MAHIQKGSFAPAEETRCRRFCAVFLPAAGNRNGSDVNNVGDNGNYWSSTANDDNNAWNVNFNDNNLNADNNNNRNNGQSVRLVCEWPALTFYRCVSPDPTTIA